MNQLHKISKSSKKSLHYNQYFQKDIFDEEFLNEKDKALRPIILSDKIPEEPKRKSILDKRGSNLKFNEDIKYGSNIVYIGSKIDDNEEESHDIIVEQINKILIQQKFCKKSPYKRRIRKKII